MFVMVVLAVESAVTAWWPEVPCRRESRMTALWRQTLWRHSMLSVHVCGLQCVVCGCIGCLVYTGGWDHIEWQAMIASQQTMHNLVDVSGNVWCLRDDEVFLVE